MTNSTGKMPELGSAGGRNTGACTPVSIICLPNSSCWIWKMLRVRSSQGFTIMPPKPPLGKVSWKLLLNSGIDWKLRKIFSVKGVTCSMVALAGVSTLPNTTPWSSVGASSFPENRYMGTTRSERTPQTM